MFGIYFFGILLVMVAICYLFKTYPVIKIVSPLLLIIIASVSFTGNRTFRQANPANLDYETCCEINSYIIEQAITADDNNITDIVLHVPKFGTASNWPLSDFAGWRITETLYQHQITHKRINIVLYPDESLNSQFGIESSVEQ